MSVCAICCDDLSPPQALFNAHGHYFHRLCIEIFKNKCEDPDKVPCPLCRRDLTPNLNKEGLGRTEKELNALVINKIINNRIQALRALLGYTSDF